MAWRWSCVEPILTEIQGAICISLIFDLNLHHKKLNYFWFVLKEKHNYEQKSGYRGVTRKSKNY